MTSTEKKKWNTDDWLNEKCFTNVKFTAFNKYTVVL